MTIKLYYKELYGLNIKSRLSRLDVILGPTTIGGGQLKGMN